MASIVGRDSVYMAGVDYDVNKFKQELQRIAEYIASKEAVAPAGRR